MSSDKLLERKVYMVVLRKSVDSVAFSDDMETEGGALYIPDRAVAVHNPRPMSRTTEYWLTATEKELVSNDKRVLAVELNPKDAGFEISLNTIVEQTGVFARNSTQTSTDLNWGLLRILEGSNRLDWGLSAWSADTSTEITDTISFNATGRNVDLIISDDNGLFVGHPEFRQLSGQEIDDNSPERIVQYDWYQHNPEVRGIPHSSPYPYLTPENSFNESGAMSSHATHVMGTAGGNRQGWARDANLYNIWYYAGEINNNFPYVMDYIRAFHANKPVNETTGIKNPTVVNSSWGMSLFPSQWAMKDIIEVTYRGVTHEPRSWALANGAASHTGRTAVCSATKWKATIGPTGYLDNYQSYPVSHKLENIQYSIITSSAYYASYPGSATVTEIGTNGYIAPTTSLTQSTTPTHSDDPNGNPPTNSAGYWQVNLPFPITFMGITYNEFYPSTRSYITFGGGSQKWSDIGYQMDDGILFPKIFVQAPFYNLGSSTYNSAGTGIDNYSNNAYISCQKIHYGSTGTSPNRIFRFVWEGTGPMNEPLVYEYKFYEAAPDTIDLTIGSNENFIGEFTTSQLNAWGFIDNQRIPVRVAALDADVEDAIDEGIIMIGAAGNGKWKHDVPGGLDWDNTFRLSNYMGSPYESAALFYMRGTSPTANDDAVNGIYDIPNICVGSTQYYLGPGNVIYMEKKGSFSDCGPGVDIYAPGEYIQSTYNFYGVAAYGTTPPDPRNNGRWAYNGHSGVFSSTTQLGSFTAEQIHGLHDISHRIITSGSEAGGDASATIAAQGGSASISSADFLVNTLGLAASVTPTVGTNIDGYWQVDLPFSITYLSESYNKVFIGTNSLLTFGTGYVGINGDPPDPDNPDFEIPSFPKIMITVIQNLARGSATRIVYGLDPASTSPNRIFQIIFEGDVLTYGTLDSPTIRYEYKFYEATPAQIDLTITQNSNKHHAYEVGKITGTSMASPQVAGLVACLMETYPHYKQEDVKAYLLSKWAVADQLYDVLTTDNPTNYSDLQGSPNVHVKYHPERQLEGNVYPKKDYHLRPTTGVMYPRPKRTIRKRPPE